ncbi:MAG: hypothetical protein CM1200mP2_48040 [Planctomycetaceae bacterium]|nr:MAG: hypothetical protein CM1200mP2_48040 [Planctomycetaceae bacterium]
MEALGAQRDNDTAAVGDRGGVGVCRLGVPLDPGHAPVQALVPEYLSGSAVQAEKRHEWTVLSSTEAMLP